MDWTIILQALIVSAFSSAIVASIVTSFLENRSDLRKRKIAAYVDFLEQYNKAVRLGLLEFDGRLVFVEIKNDSDN